MKDPQHELLVDIRKQIVLHNVSRISELSKATHVSFPTVKKMINDMIVDTSFYDRIKNKPYGPHLLRKEEIDALGRLVATFAATLNPHTFIFSDVDLILDDFSHISRACERYLPSRHIPRLLIGEWEEDYFSRLTRLGVELMFETIPRGDVY